MDEEGLHVKVLLKGDMLVRFQRLKRKLGVGSSADFIRIAITKLYEQEFKKS